jgi:carbon-monoxide dehydrogenase large subunit
VVVEEGDTDTAPFGMGTYASRSTPVAGAAVAMVSRKIRAKARKLAAHLLEVSEEDVEWELGRFYVRSAPGRGVTIQECAMAAYSNMPDGMEPGLENTAYYDPPNLTWPFAVYIVTVEVDPETGVWVGLDDEEGPGEHASTRRYGRPQGTRCLRAGARRTDGSGAP